MSESELKGRTITNVTYGYSFIELSLDDGSTWIIESTNKKSTKHQSLVDLNLYKEIKSATQKDDA